MSGKPMPSSEERTIHDAAAWALAGFVLALAAPVLAVAAPVIVRAVARALKQGEHGPRGGLRREKPRPRKRVRNEAEDRP